MYKFVLLLVLIVGVLSQETNPCEKVSCEAGYECVASEDSEGGVTTRCRATCDGYECEKGTSCKLEEVQCAKAPCDPVHSCVEDETDPCALVDCKEGFHCTDGKCVEDVNPCATVKCAAGTECVVEESSTGEATARCVPSCNGHECAEGEKCVLQKVECVTEPCDPQPTCVKEEEDPCALVDCQEGYYCADGKCVEKINPCATVKCAAGTECAVEESSTGEATARCVPSCNGHECAEGEKCVLKEVQCVTTPCDPQPTCVKEEEDPCALVDCQEGYDCVEGKCVASCKGFCPEGMTCSFDENLECVTSPCEKRKCTCPQYRCAEAVCEDGETDIDQNGCRTCSCFPIEKTCDDVKCGEGEVCQMTKIECVKEPCPDAIPECVAKEKCAVCRLFCARGFVDSGSECPKCECNPDPCDKKPCSENQFCRSFDDSSEHKCVDKEIPEKEGETREDFKLILRINDGFTEEDLKKYFAEVVKEGMVEVGTVTKKSDDTYEVEIVVVGDGSKTRDDTKSDIEANSKTYAGSNFQLVEVQEEQASAETPNDNSAAAVFISYLAISVFYLFN